MRSSLRACLILMGLSGLWIGLGLTLLPLALRGNHSGLTVTVPHSKIGLEDRLIIKITLRDTTREINDIVISSQTLANMGQVGSAHKLLFSNNQVYQQKIYDFALRPLTLGRASFSVRFKHEAPAAPNDHTYNITVVPGRLLSAQKLPLLQHTEPDPTAKDAFLVESVLEKDTLYINEPTRYRVYLYYQTAISHLSMNTPSYSGISIVELANTFLSKKTVTKNGKRYTEQLLSDNLIYPLKTGKHTIADSSLNMIVAKPGFFRSDFRKVLAIPPVTLNVRPYPEAQQPSAFRNDYGDFTLDLKQTTSPAWIHAPISLTLRIAGKGNLKALLLPDLNAHLAKSSDPLLKELSVRKELTKEAYTPMHNHFSGYKEVTYYLLSETPGTLTFPPIGFTYFSHRQKTYKTITAALAPIVIGTPAHLTAAETEYTRAATHNAIKAFALKPFEVLLASSPNHASHTSGEAEPERSSLGSVASAPVLPRAKPQQTLSTPTAKSSGLVGLFLLYHLLALSCLSGFLFIRYKQQKRPTSPDDTTKTAQPLSTLRFLPVLLMLSLATIGKENLVLAHQGHTTAKPLPIKIAATPTHAIDSGVMTQALNDYAAKDYVSALKHFQNLEEQFPDHPDILFNLALTYYALDARYPNSQISYLAHAVSTFKRAVSSTQPYVHEAARDNLIFIQLQIFLDHYEVPFYTFIRDLYDRNQSVTFLKQPPATHSEESNTQSEQDSSAPAPSESSSLTQVEQEHDGKFKLFDNLTLAERTLTLSRILPRYLLHTLGFSLLALILLFIFKLKINAPITQIKGFRIVFRSLVVLYLCSTAAFVLILSVQTLRALSTPEGTEGVIQSSVAMLYSEADAESTVLSELKEGTLLSIEVEQKGWTYVTMSKTFRTWSDTQLSGAATQGALENVENVENIESGNQTAPSEVATRTAPRVVNGRAPTLSTLEGWVLAETLLKIP